MTAAYGTSYYNLGIKYGVVPATVMPETPHSENTAQMMALIKEKLRREGYALRQAVNAAKGKRTKAVEQQKAAALNDIYRMLALCLGEPPVEFEWRYRNAGRRSGLQTLHTAGVLRRDYAGMTIRRRITS